MWICVRGLFASFAFPVPTSAGLPYVSLFTELVQPSLAMNGVQNTQFMAAGGHDRVDAMMFEFVLISPLFTLRDVPYSPFKASL